MKVINQLDNLYIFSVIVLRMEPGEVDL